MSTYRSSRASYSPVRSSTRSSNGATYVTSQDPRSTTQLERNNNVPRSYVEPIRKSTYADGKTSKTEYAVRPRHNSMLQPEVRKPLTVSTRNPSPPRRTHQYLTSPRETSSGLAHPRDDSGRYLQPNSSLHRQHHRHSSTSRADTDKTSLRDDPRERVYHVRGPTMETSRHHQLGRTQAPLYEDEEGWSYTGPREQFNRDLAHHAAPRREPPRPRERPRSVYDLDRSRDPRDVAPPPSSGRHHRHHSRSGFDSDPDRLEEVPKRRLSAKAPVVHQQQYRDDVSLSTRDDHAHRDHSRVHDDRYDEDVRRRDRVRDYYKDHDRDYDRDYERDYDRERDRAHRRDRDREHDRDRPREPDRDHDNDRRKPRSRDHSPGQSTLKTIATGALGSLAAAGGLGLLGREGKDKEAESDREDDRERRHSHRRHRRNDDLSGDSDREDVSHKDTHRRSRKIDEEDEEDEDNGYHSRRQPDRRYRDESSDDRPKRQSKHNAVERSPSRTREIDHDTHQVDRDYHGLNEPSKADHRLDETDSRAISPGEDSVGSSRRVQLVEPEDKEDVKPKGILKPARQVPFPEDPNPIREGVAPLKDAKKDGIPTTARWTKISRVLVNPEALEKMHERFEEREDYVIVLRVLSREEIQKLADKTKQIRVDRERDWQRKLEEQKRRKRDMSDDESEVSRNGEREGQLAIEAGPPAPPANFHELHRQDQRNEGGPAQSVLPAETVPVVSHPVDDETLTYSQNV